MKTKWIEPYSEEWNALPCCISIEAGPPTSLIQNIIGPYRMEDAEKWLKGNGFEQHRWNLWLQTVPVSMSYCGNEIVLKAARAWVHSLQQPSEIDFKKL